MLWTWEIPAIVVGIAASGVQSNLHGFRLSDPAPLGCINPALVSVLPDVMQTLHSLLLHAPLPVQRSNSGRNNRSIVSGNVMRPVSPLALTRPSTALQMFLTYEEDCGPEDKYDGWYDMWICDDLSIPPEYLVALLGISPCK